MFHVKQLLSLRTIVFNLRKKLEFMVNVSHEPMIVNNEIIFPAKVWWFRHINNVSRETIIFSDYKNIYLSNYNHHSWLMFHMKQWLLIMKLSFLQKYDHSDTLIMFHVKQFYSLTTRIIIYRIISIIHGKCFTWNKINKRMNKSCIYKGTKSLN